MADLTKSIAAAAEALDRAAAHVPAAHKCGLDCAWDQSCPNALRQLVVPGARTMTAGGRAFHVDAFAPKMAALDPELETGVDLNIKPVPASEVLDEAKALVSGPRQATYDSPSANFGRIAALWSVVLETPITAKQAALCMILVKAARLVKSPDHHDSLVDIAGYAEVYGLIRRDSGK